MDLHHRAEEWTAEAHLRPQRIDKGEDTNKAGLELDDHRGKAQEN